MVGFNHHSLVKRIHKTPIERATDDVIGGEGEELVTFCNICISCSVADVICTAPVLWEPTANEGGDDMDVVADDDDDVDNPGVLYWCSGVAEDITEYDAEEQDDDDEVEDGVNVNFSVCEATKEPN